MPPCVEVCGKPGTSCCEGAEEECVPGYSCQGGMCKPCGHVGEPCCADDTCEAEAVCWQGQCKKCGHAGELCCEVGEEEGEECVDEHYSCQAGRCKVGRLGWGLWDAGGWGVAGNCPCQLHSQQQTLRLS